jgi:hypothetical protein
MSNKEQTSLQSEEDRRNFLRTCGRFITTVPPAMATLLTTSLTSRAIAKSTGAGDSGNGHVDMGNGHVDFGNSSFELGNDNFDLGKANVDISNAKVNVGPVLKPAVVETEKPAVISAKIGSDRSAPKISLPR